MAQPAARDPEDRPAGQRDRWWLRWLAAGTFVLGLTLGVVSAGLLGEAPPVPTTAQGAASGAAPTSPAGPDGRIELDPACLRALNAARDIAVTVDDLGAAAAALDAAQLDEVVRRLQPLQARLQENTAACEATGSLPTRSAQPTDDQPTEDDQPTRGAEPAAPGSASPTD